MKLAVSYARYSSNNQRDASIEDQQRKCRQYAEREGQEITVEYVDRALTGKSESRPDYVRLLADAKKGEIGVIYVDDLSRLSRSSTTAATVDEFKYYGVRLVAISDGIDSDTKSSKIAVGMKSMMNNVFLDDLKEKVHRGLEGNALKGHNTGGRVFGYDPEPHFSSIKMDIYGRPEIEYVTRKINAEHARIVLQIFEWAAEGRAYNWIAKELNMRRIPSPQGSTWTSSTITSSVGGRPLGILNNRLYNGELIWNKTETVHNPISGQERKRCREESQWIVTQREELRIVSDDLWKAVKHRQQHQQQQTADKQRASHKNARTGRSPGYLFSGVLKCAECGAAMIMVDKCNYRCGSAHRRGEAICSNKQKVSRTEIERVLLASVKSDLFSPAVIAEFHRETARVLKERKGELDPSIKGMMSSLKRLTEQEDGLVNLIVECPETKTLRAISDKLRSIQIEKSDFQSRLETEQSMMADISPILPRAEEIFREMVANLPEALSKDIEPLRNQIIPLVGGDIRMKPDGKGGWEATFRGSFRGFLMLGVAKHKISHDSLEAGFLYG